VRTSKVVLEPNRRTVVPNWTHGRFLVISSAALLASACSSRNVDSAASCGSAGCTRSEQTVAAIVDLISPSTCTLQSSRLVNCAIKRQTLTETPFETAVPLRTTVASRIGGTCPTRWPLQVALSGDGQTPVTLAYYLGGQAVLRRSDGGVISSIAVSDDSTWTGHAVFDASCRISLEVSPNEVDVAGKADAQAIIDRLTKDVAAKQATRDNYRALDLYHQAYVFLRNVADNFLGQLTNDQMQELRSAAVDAQPSLEALITSCDNLTQDQRMALLRLELGLAALGHPEDWVNADGSKKTLKDFLGGADQQVLSAIDQLDGNGDGGTPPNYDGLYKQAEADYQAALNKLRLAQQQLAPYLS
jgi:hypothetical protein